MRRPTVSWLAVAVLAAVSGGRAIAAPDAGEAKFLRDLQALTSSPHRLSGTPEGAAAAEYVRQRLVGMGAKVFTLDMPVWQTKTVRCELSVEGQTIGLLPMRPDMVVPPTTPAEGFSGPLVYAGQGRMEDYGARNPAGAIVVLDYGSYGGWKTALAMGAKAVLFLGDTAPEAVNLAAPYASTAANLVRLYVPPESQKKVDLRRDYGQATVVSQVVWEQRTGTNVLGYIPGTAPDFVESQAQPEMLVLAASLDSFGNVPEASPSARLAANAAALLETGEYLMEHRPRRDVLLMFLDNHARLLQGARYVYDGLLLKDYESDKVRQNHRDEYNFLVQLRAILDVPTQHLVGDVGQLDAVLKLLDQQAFRLRSGVDAQYMQVRLRKQSAAESEQAVLHAREEELAEQRRQWDQVRRVLNRARQSMDRRGSEDVEPARYEQVKAAALAVLGARLGELQALIRWDDQRQELRLGIGARSILAHVEFDLADQSPAWSFVAGHAWGSMYNFLSGSANSRRGANDDTPGRHNWLLRALKQAAQEVKEPLNLAMLPLEDPEKGPAFGACYTLPNGMVAGVYGIYNVSLMTGNDGRPREGHPCDTLGNLDWRTLRTQARQAARVLEAAANVEAVSVPKQFINRSTSVRPIWSQTSISGNAAVLKASGSLVDDWPAAGALVAVCPSASWWPNNPWVPANGTPVVAALDPFIYEAVDCNGRFSLIGVSQDDFTNFMAFAVTFDASGAINAATSSETQFSAYIDRAKLELFPGRGFTQVAGTYSSTYDDLMQVLRAGSNAELRTNRSTVNIDQGVIFFYAHQYDLQADAGTGQEARFKLYQSNVTGNATGPMVLNIQPGHPYGLGMSVQQLSAPLAIDRWTAEDRLKLNELRLSALRQRGVVLRDLERLHSAAARSLEQVEARGTQMERQGQLAVSLGLSNRVYTPLREAMNDLINGVVVLLLLAIPFAFSLERLLVCASTVYGRVTGFAACFLVTFVLLYLMHPGFAVANTPVMILLAFSIILLSSLVCFIIVRKFRNELMTLQGQATGHHQVEISRMGTLLAAVGMGMSTMRRRPLRTLLTAVTVVMLTFTILIFASFSSEWGVRAAYQRPVDDTQKAAVVTHRLDYSRMTSPALQMQTVAPAGSKVFEQYWRIREGTASRPFTVARRDDGRNLQVQAVMGVDVEEMALWPALGEVVQGRSLEERVEGLKSGGVYLPHVIASQLGLAVGDTVLVDGWLLKVAGTLDEGALLRLRHLDGRSILPVDFEVMEAERERMRRMGDRPQALNDDRVQRDFQRVDPSELVIASMETVKRIGGGVYAATLYTPAGAIDPDLGPSIARLVDLPVWSRTGDGAYRLFFTELASISGGMALVVPVLLGGLIIFGTMLGSITDREKEIYTFSALGLGPAHVGFLFFAEAAVYAVVGGMGGQLLAQAVALATKQMAQWGWIQPASLNFSSTNSLFAIAIVMGTVLVSAIYPAIRASRSANPGLARSWKMPKPQGDEISATFPFTVSSYDITGVMSFLAEHFRQHDDAGLGIFACTGVEVRRRGQDGELALEAQLALAPFDLGVTQAFELAAAASEIPGVDEVTIRARRLSGAKPDWQRANRVFIHDLRRQFLLWRTLSNETIEEYRQQTLTALAGEGKGEEGGGESGARERTDTEVKA